MSRRANDSSTAGTYGGSKIYFVQAGDESRPIKIGVAKNAEARLRELQVGCPDELNLLAVIDGDELGEAAFHSSMASHRVRGEWFRPAPELLDLITAINTGDDYAYRRSVMAQIRRRRSPSVLIEAPVEMVRHLVRLRELVAVRNGAPSSTPWP